jgi:hypothetical protein
MGAMALDVPAALPLDAFERRAQWQLATVLWVLAGLARAPEPAAPSAPLAPRPASRPVAVSKARRATRPRRPPRSC